MPKSFTLVVATPERLGALPVVIIITNHLALKELMGRIRSTWLTGVLRRWKETISGGIFQHLCHIHGPQSTRQSCSHLQEVSRMVKRALKISYNGLEDIDEFQASIKKSPGQCGPS